MVFDRKNLVHVSFTSWSGGFPETNSYTISDTNGDGECPTASPFFSFRKVKINFAGAGDIHRLNLLFHAFMPGHHVVLAIRYIADLEVSATVGLDEVRSWTDDEIARHLRVDVAK